MFLKYLHVEQLNIAVSEFARRVAACQKHVRGFVARRRYAGMKEMAKKCEEDVKQLNDVVTRLTDCLKPLQKKFHDEDAKHHEESLRAEEKRKAEEKKKSKEQKSDEQTVNSEV